MTTFYDPKTKKTKPWVAAVFILIPIIVAILIFVITKNIADRNSYKESKTTAEDIFK